MPPNPNDNKPTPPVNTAAPTPPESPKAKAKEEGKPLPLSIQDVIGTPQEQVVRNWNAQAKAGIIFQCKEDGCYYPLAPLRDANNQPVMFRTKYKGKNGKELVKEEFVMTCTFHPDHGSTITLPSNVVVLKDGQRINTIVGFKMAAPSKVGDDLDMA